jgi:uncharacterized protein with WD repeat
VASTKRTARKSAARKKYVPSEQQRASDEDLLDQLRRFDLKKFDQALDKAINHALPPIKRQSHR